MSLTWARSDPPEFYRPLLTKPQGPSNDEIGTGYRPPAWLWILVVIGLVVLTKALMMGWKATHP